ncbi:Berardinelli-Seip congenital lipodystrophy 2 (seipin) [Geranomyces variabilis]|uniref:Berardinelli-Seip congenital lipodystrophy 2 (Seipin) n=1 Tax=Geranomyces variabilis TaxID=109894 RepID=A0AAD5XQF5_9FUNG|nr:Berardinelli-Seip congenital lipodystrophy 2 (seipin) [Geranomyces variabilis]
MSIRDKLARYVTNPIQTFSEPYLRLGYDGLTSAKTQRLALNTAIFGAVFAALLSFAIAVYCLFYAVYIPRVNWVIPVYMQYGPPGSSLQPHAYVDFTQGNGQQSAYLTPEQHYDLALELVVPDSHSNFELGNFMVYIDLRTKDNKTTASSSRPAILEYRTPLLRYMRTMWNGLPLLLGLTKEAQTVKLLMLEKYEEMQISPIHHALIRISDSRIQLYEMRLHIEANFQGLRYFMYHWQATTGSVFVAAFLFWGTLVSFAGWRLLLSLFKSRDGTESSSAPSSTGEPDSHAPSVEGSVRGTHKSVEMSVFMDRLDGSADGAGSNSAMFDPPPPSVLQSSNLLSSPRSMSSAPSYHSGSHHPPFGSPPQYAARTSPPPSFDVGRTSPYLNPRGSSAYSYAFPYSSAGFTGGGMLPYTGYSSVSALRAAVAGSSADVVGSSPALAYRPARTGHLSPALPRSLSPLPPPATPPVIHSPTEEVEVEEEEEHCDYAKPGRGPGSDSGRSDMLSRDDTIAALDVQALDETAVSPSSPSSATAERSLAGLRLRRRSVLNDGGGRAAAGGLDARSDDDVMIGSPTRSPADLVAPAFSVAAEEATGSLRPAASLLADDGAGHEPLTAFLLGETPVEEDLPPRPLSRSDLGGTTAVVPDSGTTADETLK